MKNAGWILGTNYAPKPGGNRRRLIKIKKKCRRQTNGGTNWFGQSDIGTVSAPLQGNGEAKLDFGNCWTTGEVKVYLNDREVASAQKNTPSKIVSFKFHDGDILKLRDEGANSVIAINDITFRCSSGRTYFGLLAYLH